MAEPGDKVVVVVVVGTRERVEEITLARAAELHRYGMRREAFRQQARFCAVSMLVALANLAAGSSPRDVVLGLLLFNLSEVLFRQLSAVRQGKRAGVEP
jgi:hypothetical protein